jgi:hypothetical protein
VVDTENVVAMPPLWHVLHKKLVKNEVFHDLWFKKCVTFWERMTQFLRESDALSQGK